VVFRVFLEGLYYPASAHFPLTLTWSSLPYHALPHSCLQALPSTWNTTSLPHCPSPAG
jgi:hypothetical protein